MPQLPPHPGTDGLPARIRRGIGLFVLALSFLSRLAPARVASTKDMGASCLYYPLVGLVLGGLAVLPLWLGLFSDNSWAQAWTYALLGLWLTRALHHDGFADLLDALGSGKSGEAFRAVMKDSRIGSFGAAGLVMAFAAQIIFAQSCLAANNLSPLVYAYLFGRCLSIFLARIAPASPSASLGLIFASAPMKAACLFACVCLLAGGLLLMPPAAWLCSLCLGGALLLFFRAKALEHGGYNGDFFGALIVSGELAALFAAAAF